MNDEQQTKGQAAAEAEDTPVFEALMDELDGIVGRLERGELSLEESLAAFERGVSASRSASAILDAAEARVDVLVRADSDETVPFGDA